MESMNMKYLIFALIPILGLGGVIWSNHHEKQAQLKVIENRKQAIRQASQDMYKPCQDISTFDKRRECFKDQMTQMRAQNKKVPLEFQVIINHKASKVEVEDLGDLLKISKPNIGFLRCQSNTFFFDWVGDFVYISMENPLPKIECMDVDNRKITFIPINLSQEDIRFMNQEFNKKIE